MKRISINMTKSRASPSLENAVEYDCRRLVKTKVRISSGAAWPITLGFIMICSSVFLMNADWKHIQHDGIRFLHQVFRKNGEVPLAEGGTILHHTSEPLDRSKRAAMDRQVSRNAIGTQVQVGQTSSAAGSGSGDATTSPTEGSADVTTASVIDGSGEITTSSMNGSGEATTASMFDASGDSTTASMFDPSGSGDSTTTTEDLTTSPMDMSGDETTSPMDFSGETTTAMEASGMTTVEASGTTAGTTFAGGTTDSMFESSGTTAPTDGTTAEASGTATASGAGTTATEEFKTDDDQTTAFEVTTGIATEGPDSDELLVPLFVAIIAGVVGLVLGILLVFAIKAFKKWLKQRKKVTPSHTPSGSRSTLRDDDLTRPPELNWLMAREDTLLKAMAIGQISVLEFALVESRAAGLMNENPTLMKDAETKLNMWKRTRTQLENSYRDRDLDEMEEFMRRFNESGMKDDTGAYQRCVDLKWNIKHAELSMQNAADSRNEAMLITSTGQFESLKLQSATMAATPAYLHAKQVLEEIRQEKLLQGQSHDVFRMDLRAAVISRDPAAISLAMDKFIKAEIPDVYDDIPNANKVLETIEAERHDNLEVAQKKLEEASFNRDQDALRNAIEECKKFGATEEELKGPEKLLRTVEREDALLAELRTLTSEEDIAKLSNAIVVFKTPTVEMVDKTGDLAKAEEVLEKLKHKERMKKAKEDVLWRLQNAMTIGDVYAMDGMIKALQAMAASGEEIDEALVIRAMGELEACRGQVDYRKRMEAIKNAMERSLAAENVPQAQDLVDQMSMLAEDQEYTMTADDSRVLDQARSTLNDLRNKQEVMQELTVVRPELVLPLIPPNLKRLQEAVGRMEIAKKDAEAFEGVFTMEDSVLLEESKVNANVLNHKVTIMNQARDRLDLAVETREYTELKHAIRNAIEAPFIERKELMEPRKLAVFLDPKARRMAVKKAMRARDIPMLEVALQDFKDAKVEDETLLLKGERTLDKLRKRERRQGKEERKKERADKRRMEEIARLTNILQQAIASRDTEHLQLALEEFEESGLDYEDVPIVAQAEELFDTLKIQDLRDRLLDSIKRRDVTGLENAIDDADYGGFVMDVKEEYDIAKALLYHLRELNNLRAAISEMNRSLISEIHKYPQPPPTVHQVMTGVFVLLGESPKKMKDWTEVQALLGKLGHNAITRRVRLCVPGDIPSAAVKKAEQQLRGLKLDELAEISKGAATFYAWTICMIKEHAQVSSEQRALADIGLPDIGLPDRPVTRGGDFAWVEENA